MHSVSPHVHTNGCRLASLDQLRNNAAECIRLAEAVRTSERKVLVIEMAESASAEGALGRGLLAAVLVVVLSGYLPIDDDRSVWAQQADGRPPDGPWWKRTSQDRAPFLRISAFAGGPPTTVFEVAEFAGGTTGFEGGRGRGLLEARRVRASEGRSMIAQNLAVFSRSSSWRYG